MKGSEGEPVLVSQRNMVDRPEPLDLTDEPKGNLAAVRDGPVARSKGVQLWTSPTPRYEGQRLTTAIPLLS